jgi:hypothetical protein
VAKVFYVDLANAYLYYKHGYKSHIKYFDILSAADILVVGGNMPIRRHDFEVYMIHNHLIIPMIGTRELNTSYVK